MAVFHRNLHRQKRRGNRKRLIRRRNEYQTARRQQGQAPGVANAKKIHNSALENPVDEELKIRETSTSHKTISQKINEWRKVLEKQQEQVQIANATIQNLEEDLKEQKAQVTKANQTIQSQNETINQLQAVLNKANGRIEELNKLII